MDEPILRTHHHADHDEQRQTDRQLVGDQRSAQPRADRGAATAPGPFQRCDEIKPQRLQSRRDTRQAPGQKGEAERAGKDTPVRRESPEQRKGREPLGDVLRHIVGERDAAERGTAGEGDRLGQELSQ
jgi:hypothetical protein